MPYTDAMGRSWLDMPTPGGAPPPAGKMENLAHSYVPEWVGAGRDIGTDYTRYMAELAKNPYAMDPTLFAKGRRNLATAQAVSAQKRKQAALSNPLTGPRSGTTKPGRNLAYTNAGEVQQWLADWDKMAQEIGDYRITNMLMPWWGATNQAYATAAQTAMGDKKKQQDLLGPLAELTASYSQYRGTKTPTSTPTKP